MHKTLMSVFKVIIADSGNITRGGLYVFRKAGGKTRPHAEKGREMDDPAACLYRRGRIDPNGQ